MELEMKKLTLGVALCVASFSANAADLPVPAPAPAYKAPAVIVPSTYNWTGFYIGGNVGYGWGTSKPGTISFYDPIDTFQGSQLGINASPKGVVGGVQAGYNYQINSLVLGIEADWSASGMKGSVTDVANAYTATTKIDWLATARARAGFAMDRALIYVTGGVAAGHVKNELIDSSHSGTVFTTESSATHVGWTVGGGAEYAVMPNWTVKAEYLYADLGSKEFNFYENGLGGWPRITGKAAVTTSIARVGANFKF
jgi:outer membrane immunogenic protein